MVVRESPTVEYKESVTPTFLKTVSAYANYGTGKIEFGVDDEGVAVGLADPIAECLRIENMINDSLDPAPRYTLERDEKHGTVILTVYEARTNPIEARERPTGETIRQRWRSTGLSMAG